jgi:hypothetical protein
MWARDLCGRHIGERICWAKVTIKGGTRPEVEWLMMDEPITMITHSKNSNRVYIRYAKGNKALHLLPDTPIREVSNA